jgi:hypothetical protein
MLNSRTLKIIIMICVSLFVIVLLMKDSKPTKPTKLTVISNPVHSNPDGFNYIGQAVEGKYTITLDLLDVESNIGKELFNDGTHKIVVAEIKDYQGYIIKFRSKGKFSKKGGTLVSGIQHHLVGAKHTPPTRDKVKITASYNGQTFDSSIHSWGGLNYLDGDYFSFRIFPSRELYKAINLEEERFVTLTVTDLYKNIWQSK